MTETIKRAPRNKAHPYVMALRANAQNRELSFEARGMLWYLLSKPDDWTINLKDLQNEGGRGREYTRRVLGELKKAGHLVLTQEFDDSGKFSAVDYLLFEIPPESENPSCEKPVLRETNPIHNKESLQKKEKEPLSDKKSDDENSFDFQNATVLQRSKQMLGLICFENPLDRKIPPGTSKRINTIKREIYAAYSERPKTDFTAELFRYAADCYIADKPVGFNLPQDAVKFVAAMRDYIQIWWDSKDYKQAESETLPPDPVLTEEEAAAKRWAARPKVRGRK